MYLYASSSTLLPSPHYCNVYCRPNYTLSLSPTQSTLSANLRAIINDWDGEESWRFVNSPTRVLAIAARSRLEELGLL